MKAKVILFTVNDRGVAGGANPNSVFCGALGDDLWNGFQESGYLRAVESDVFPDVAGDFDLLLVWEPAAMNDGYPAKLVKLKDELHSHVGDCTDVFALLHGRSETLHKSQFEFVAELFSSMNSKPHITKRYYAHEPRDQKYTTVASVLSAARNLMQEAYRSTWTQLLSLLSRPQRIDAAGELFLPFLYGSLCVLTGKPVSQKIPEDGAIQEAYKRLAGKDMPALVKKHIATIRTACAQSERAEHASSDVVSALTGLGQSLNRLVNDG